MEAINLRIVTAERPDAPDRKPANRLARFQRSSVSIVDALFSVRGSKIVAALMIFGAVAMLRADASLGTITVLTNWLARVGIGLDAYILFSIGCGLLIMNLPDDRYYLPFTFPLALYFIATVQAATSGFSPLVAVFWYAALSWFAIREAWREGRK